MEHRNCSLEASTRAELGEDVPTPKPHLALPVEGSCPQSKHGHHQAGPEVTLGAVPVCPPLQDASSYTCRVLVT